MSRSSTRSDFTSSTRQSIHERFNNRCAFCLRTSIPPRSSLEVDHIIPASDSDGKALISKAERYSLVADYNRTSSSNGILLCPCDHKYITNGSMMLLPASPILEFWERKLGDNFSTYSRENVRQLFNNVQSWPSDIKAWEGWYQIIPSDDNTSAPLIAPWKPCDTWTRADLVEKGMRVPSSWHSVPTARLSVFTPSAQFPPNSTNYATQNLGLQCNQLHIDSHAWQIGTISHVAVLARLICADSPLKQSDLPSLANLKRITHWLEAMVVRWETKQPVDKKHHLDEGDSQGSDPNLPKRKLQKTDLATEEDTGEVTEEEPPLAGVYGSSEALEEWVLHVAPGPPLPDLSRRGSPTQVALPEPQTPPPDTPIGSLQFGKSYSSIDIAKELYGVDIGGEGSLLRD